MVEKFLEGFEKKVSPRAMRRFLAYEWPGNIRQLQNVIERARVLSDGDIEPDHLSPEVLAVSSKVSTMVDESGNLKDAKEDLEKKLILDTMAQVGGNKSNAAKILGLSRYGLYKKIKRYNLE